MVVLSCSRKDNSIQGEWKMINWNGEIPSLDIVLKFYSTGEYIDSRSEGGIWNYEYYEPDSLILYHHGYEGERYRILQNANDTLVIQLKEFVVYLVDHGEDIEDVINEDEPIFTFVRK